MQYNSIVFLQSVLLYLYDITRNLEWFIWKTNMKCSKYDHTGSLDDNPTLAKIGRWQLTLSLVIRHTCQCEIGLSTGSSTRMYVAYYGVVCQCELHIVNVRLAWTWIACRRLNSHLSYGMTVCESGDLESRSVIGDNYNHTNIMNGN